MATAIGGVFLRVCVCVCAFANECVINQFSPLAILILVH